MKQRVLVVEDERRRSPNHSREHLAREGFDPNVRRNHRTTRERAFPNPPPWAPSSDPDVMLPDGDGRDLCREIRPIGGADHHADRPRREIDKIVGLELGADDYVVKPFSCRRARRPDPRRPAPGSALRASPASHRRLRLDPAREERPRTKNPLELRRNHLLPIADANAGEVFTREEIMDEVWDPALVRTDEDPRRPRLVAP